MADCVKDVYADIGKLDNISALKAYILRQLGSPRICVELSDEQLTDVIGDSIRYFWKYYSRGHREDYLMFELIPGMTKYKICQELQEVIDLSLASWLGNGNELFNMVISQKLARNILPSMGISPYGGDYTSVCSSDYGDVLGSWNASLTWLEEARMDFGRDYRISYNPEAKELSIWPTPKRPEQCLLRVYKREMFINIIQDPLFREFVVAKAGWLWTLALRKYSLTLSGGGTLNGDSLAADFKESITNIKERIDLETPVNEILVG